MNPTILKHRGKQWGYFVSLFLFYFNIIITFALVYWLLDVSGLGPIVDHYATLEHQNNGLDRLYRAIYFSAVTLLSVGYGDLTPFGLSRGVAILEAIIGFILPAVLVIQLMSPRS